MSMNFYPRKRRVPQVIIVSMIDIFAILLIFVIVTTTFKVPNATQPSVTIRLPESKTAAESEAPTQVGLLEILFNENNTEPNRKFTVGEIKLDGKPVELAGLAAAVKQRLADKPGEGLAMRADERISYGFLISVLDELKEAGVQGNLSAFTEKKK